MYVRSTQEIALETAPAALLGAIREHAARHQLTLDARARAWLTRSENPIQAGMLGKLFGRRANPVDPDPSHDTVLLLLPTHVLVARSGERSGTSVVSVALVIASLAPPPSVPLGAGAADGVWIDGFPGTPGRPGTLFVGLGAPAGVDCTRALEDAMRAAKQG